ncbi:MAG: sigma-70 family RNA polymerase sigma factor [Bacteroidetes bacterium]|nr:sigma-70 family RNA polymerase sigma factor [Fibrella sp.]
MVSLEPAHWVERHADVLFSVALVHVKNQAVAEDIVQETFMAGLKALDQFRGQSQERTWLTAILRHKIADYFRTQARQPMVSLGDVFYDNYFDRDANGDFDHWRTSREPADWVTDEESAESDALSTVLYSCLAKLSPRYTQLVTLRFLDNVDSKEICQELGISSSNYWTLLHRVKILLRECLEKNWYSVR